MSSVEEKRFEYLVDDLRLRFIDDGALLFVDHDMKLALVSWRYIERRIIDVESDDPWEMVEFNFGEWADLAGLKVKRLKSELFPRIRKMRLAYPDGTLPEKVKQTL